MNGLDIEYENGRVKRLEIDGKSIIDSTTEVTLRLAVDEVPQATIEVRPFNGFVAIDECETKIVPQVVVVDRRAGSSNNVPARSAVRY